MVEAIFGLLFFGKRNIRDFSVAESSNIFIRMQVGHCDPAGLLRAVNSLSINSDVSKVSLAFFFSFVL